MTLEVRPGRPEDGPALRRVERLAGQAFRTLGMDDVAEDELSPGLRAVRDAEAAHGLDPTLRVCMRRDL